MQGKMKSRVMALGILAIMGIAASFGYIVIAAEVGGAKEAELLILYYDEETGTMRMLDKGGREIALNITGGKLLEEPATVVVIKAAKLTEEEKAKALEIALNDPRVKELLEGKEYKILSVGPITEIVLPDGEPRKAGAVVEISVPEERYLVLVSLEKEEVTHIQQVLSLKPLEPPE